MGHKKAFCYRFTRKIHQAWKAGKCFIERRWFGKVWTAKDDFYPRSSKVDESEEIVCNHVMIDTEEDEINNEPELALMVNEQNVVGDWYFDSGCSRHMTGNGDVLKDLVESTGKRVMFGDGKKGIIQRVGTIDQHQQPTLVNVYLVEG